MDDLPRRLAASYKYEYEVDQQFCVATYDGTGCEITYDLESDIGHKIDYSLDLLQIGLLGMTPATVYESTCTCAPCSAACGSMWKIDCVIKSKYILYLTKQYQSGKPVVLNGVTQDPKARVYGHEQKHIRSLNQEARDIGDNFKNQTGDCAYTSMDSCNTEASNLKTDIDKKLKEKEKTETTHSNKGSPKEGVGEDPNGAVPD